MSPPEQQESVDIVERPRRRTMVRDLILSLLLGVACVLVGGIVTLCIRGDSAWDLWILCGFLSFGVTLPSLALMHSSWIFRYPAAAPLLVTIWRMGSYVFIVLMRDATNWPPDNLFLTCLQGCYFPYLLLESALFINQVRD